MINLLHIPEGVRDIYGSECINKSKFENSVKEKLHSYGYQDVVTPTFEYFDIFNKERGTIRSRDMFKFFDKDGNTLVLRPDITPQLARVAAKYYRESELPVRLCYRAKQYINHSSLQGKLKETTVLGAELYNDDSVAADFEMIALMTDSLLACGLERFRIEIGITGFLEGIVEEAGLKEEDVEELRELLLVKNIFGIEDFAESRKMPAESKKVMSVIAELYGGAEVLETAAGFALNETSKAALERLVKLNEMLEKFGYGKYVSYDLSMLSKYTYYTGIFFRGITTGVGEAIAYGGRYDRLVSQFGYDAPAIGMSVTLDYIMMGLDRRGELETVPFVNLVFYSPDKEEEAIKTASELRSKGEAARLVRDNTGKLYESFIRKEDDSEVNRFIKELEGFDVKNVIRIGE